MADCCTEAHAPPHVYQDCSQCSLVRKTKTLRGVIYLHNVLRLNVSPIPGDKCGKHGNSHALQSKASLSLRQFSRKSQSLCFFFRENLLYLNLSKCQENIVERGQNFIRPQKWSTVNVTSVFAKPINAQQHGGVIKLHLTGSRNMKITGSYLTRQ